VSEERVEDLIAGQEARAREPALGFLLTSFLLLALPLAPNLFQRVDVAVVRKRSS
jgi:hypothetical protein